MDKETLQRASRLQQRIDRIIAFQRDLRENPQIIVESRSSAATQTVEVQPSEMAKEILNGKLTFQTNLL